MDENNKMETLKKDLEALTKENNCLTMEIKDLYEDLTNSKIREESLEKDLKKEHRALNQVRSKLDEVKSKRAQCEIRFKAGEKKSMASIHKLEKEVAVLKRSYAFRMGRVLVDAVARPGKNTLMLPLRLVRLIFEPVFKPKRT